MPPLALQVRFQVTPFPYSFHSLGAIISIWGDAFCLQYEQLTYKKKFLIVRLKASILTAKLSRCKNLHTYGPGPQINLIPGAGLIFFTNLRYALHNAHVRFYLYVVCSL
jgi:hypothetical protein